MFKLKRETDRFQVRSTSRDAETDSSRLKLVSNILERVAFEAETERTGLQSRLATVLVQASITIGNGTDEYTTRDEAQVQHQSKLNDDIRYAEGRIADLEHQIERFYMLKQLCTDERLIRSLANLKTLLHN